MKPEKIGPGIVARPSSPTSAKSNESASSEPAPKIAKTRREIPGNFTYTTAYGALKRALDGIINAERPEKFSLDFIQTVLKVSGGSARPIPPILKRMGFLTSDGSPTDLYSKFKSESERSAAALDGLRRAFPEIFRRNEFAHRANKDDVADLVVQVTGLNKGSQIVNSISGTFESIRNFVNKSQSFNSETESELENNNHQTVSQSPPTKIAKDLSLNYHINIVMPETTNIQVFNAIFQSLKNNLLS